MKLTWIVVANNTQARFFTAETESSPFTEIAALTHQEGRLHDREITADLPGRHKGEVGAGGHAFEQATDPKQHEAELFARQVVDYLETGHNEGKFSQLLLVAEPSFLGLLRNHLSEPLKKLVIYELDKNIATETAAEIRVHLPDYLPKSQ